METKNIKNLKILKLALFILVIIIVTFVTVKLFPMFSNLGTPEGQQKFKNEITNQGVVGVIYLIGLQLLQILIPILPGEPIEFLAGMCYGTWGRISINFYRRIFKFYYYIFCCKKIG